MVKLCSLLYRFQTKFGARHSRYDRDTTTADTLSPISIIKEFLLSENYQCYSEPYIDYPISIIAVKETKNCIMISYSIIVFKDGTVSYADETVGNIGDPDVFNNLLKKIISYRTILVYYESVLDSVVRNIVFSIFTTFMVLRFICMAIGYLAVTPLRKLRLISHSTKSSVHD